jgi:hypothetical protein
MDEIKLFFDIAIDCPDLFYHFYKYYETKEKDDYLRYRRKIEYYSLFGIQGTE